MITFWIIASIMIVIGLLMLFPALTGRKQKAELNRNAQNVQIARERLEEIKLDLANGVLSEDEYKQSRRELEQTLLDNMSDSGESIVPGGEVQTNRWILLVLALAVPALSIPMYLWVGTPELLEVVINPQVVTAQHPAKGQQENLPTIDEMIVKLSARLQEQPGDSKGWMMLGRSYMHLKRYSDATVAFKRAYELVGDDPVVLLYYADALAMNNGGRLSGEPAKVINKALQASPDNPKGLWLAGMAAEEEGNHEAALRYWRKLEPLLVNDQESLNEVRSLISQVERKAGINSSVMTAPAQDIQTSASSGSSISVKVDISPEFKAGIHPDETLFIFARASQGPPMPLAVVKKKAGDLPVEVVLDDSMAMTQGMSISKFSEVQIAARISKTGNALPQRGDFTSSYVTTRTDNKDVIIIVINKKVE